MRKSILSITVGAVAIASVSSCQKGKSAVAPNAQNAVAKKMTNSTAKAYDYMQPVDQIISDAGVDLSQVYKSIRIPGYFIYHGPRDFECYRWPTTCMIITISKNHAEPTGGKTGYTGGTPADPIGVIQAYESWPQYNASSSVTYYEEGESTFVNFNTVD